MKKILFVLLFITSSLFAQDEIKRHPMWKDAGGGIMTPKAQYNLNPFSNQLGNLGATGVRWNFAYLDTTTTNHLNNTTWTLNSVAVTATGTQFNYLSGATGTTGTTTSNLVFSTSPTFTTPILGAATGTSLALSGNLTLQNTTSKITFPNLELYSSTSGWFIVEGARTIEFLARGFIQASVDDNLQYYNNASVSRFSLINGNLTLPDPGTSINSGSISLVADNATTPQTGKIQVMYGANPYMRFSPPNAAGTATAFIDLKSNQMIFPDSTSLTTNTGASDAMLFKAVDNDDGLLYEVARLNGGTTPTFDLLVGRLTGALSGNSQNITGVGQLAATTYGSDGSVSNAELLFINTLSSNAQTQIDTKAPSTSPTFATSITGSYLTASEMLITDGSKNIVSAPVATYPSLTELTYVKGVTSAIQTQLNLKAPLASPTFTGTVTIPTPFTLGAISVTATGTELNYVAGVTSSVQTQLNSKAPTANPTFTGTVKRSVTATITASTTQTQGQGALTTDVNEVSVVANVNDVVTLPSAIAGMEIFIINNGANTLQIYPASGDNLGAGLNASTTLVSASNVTFVSYNDTNWEIK